MILRFARRATAVNQEETTHLAWLTAMLTATGVNSPKQFPKSASELIKKSEPKKPFSKEQWAATIRMLTGGNREKPKKKNLPRYSDRSDP